MNIAIDLKLVLFIGWAVLMFISIIINLCILLALKKQSKGTITEAIKKGFSTANDIISKLDINGIGDTINLIKDIITPITEDKGAKENDESGKT